MKDLEEFHTAWRSIAKQLTDNPRLRQASSPFSTRLGFDELYAVEDNVADKLPKGSRPGGLIAASWKKHGDGGTLSVEII